MAISPEKPTEESGVPLPPPVTEGNGVDPDPVATPPAANVVGWPLQTPKMPEAEASKAEPAARISRARKAKPKARAKVSRTQELRQKIGRPVGVKPLGEAAAPTEETESSPFEEITREVSENASSVFDDLDALREGMLPDEDQEDVQEILSSCPVRRPGKRAIRTRPEPQYQFEAHILENIKENTAFYIIPSVGKVLAEQAIENFKQVVLVLCIGKSGHMFWWPVPSRGTFRSSGLMAVGLARDNWVKAVGDFEAGGFKIFKMNHEDYGEPAWPTVMPSAQELLKLTFGDNIITKANHPEIKVAKNV
jgi:hypothetical protein